MMPTLLSLVPPEVVIMTTSGATSDNKVGIMTTLGPQQHASLLWMDSLNISTSVTLSVLLRLHDAAEQEASIKVPFMEYGT